MITDSVLRKRIQELLKQCMYKNPEYTHQEVHDWVYEKIQTEELFNEEEMEHISADIWKRLNKKANLEKQ